MDYLKSLIGKCFSQKQEEAAVIVASKADTGLLSLDDSSFDKSLRLLNEACKSLTQYVTLKIYDNDFVGLKYINVEYIPSIALGVAAISLVIAGSYGSVKKPKNAKFPSKKHVLFDNTDIIASSKVNSAVEEIGKISEKSALLFPIIAALFLLGTYKLIKSSKIESVLQYLKLFLFINLVVGNLQLTADFMRNFNRMFLKKIMNTSWLEKQIRFTISNCDDDSFTPCLSLLNERKIKEEDEALQKKINKFFETMKLNTLLCSKHKSEEENSSEEFEKLKVEEQLRINEKYLTMIKPENQTVNYFVSYYEIISGAFSSVFAFIAYHNYDNWIVSNIIGCIFVLCGLKLNRIPNFKAGTLLLVLLFFYDIYFVFFSDVMVTVAVNMDIPAKLSFPKFIEQGANKNWSLLKPAAAMLGLGDIVVPGLFISLCLRFDYFKHFEAYPNKEFHFAEFDFNFFKKVICGKKDYLKSSYFNAAVSGYVAGLLMTLTSLHYFRSAQPALLYLCPCVLIFVFTYALVKGEFKKLWEFSEHLSKEEEKANIDSLNDTIAELLYDLDEAYEEKYNVYYYEDDDEDYELEDEEEEDLYDEGEEVRDNPYVYVVEEDIVEEE